MKQSAAYDHDFYAWTQRQSFLLRSGTYQQADFEHIAEEIESLGKREKRELISRLEVILEVILLHLLKWQYQLAKRGSSWSRAIKEQRIRIAGHLIDNPSLGANSDALLLHAYPLAVIAAIDETGLAENRFPADCPYRWTESSDPDFWPQSG